MSGKRDFNEPVPSGSKRKHFHTIGVAPTVPCTDNNALAHVYDYAWFAGFAPAGSRDAPRIVVCVFIEYGGGGGQTAGPLAKVVFSRLIALGYLTAKPGHIPKPPENYLSGAAATATEPIFSPGALPPPQDETMTEPVAA